MRVQDRLLASRVIQFSALVGMLLAGLSTALAGPVFDYSGQPRTLRACRLLVNGQSGDDPNLQDYQAGGSQAGAVPHSLIFESMRRYPNKPASWDIENPLAPRAAIVANQPNLVKSSPLYWEVALNATTESQLENFDLIYIYASNINVANLNERDALVRAVHNGAVLWIDQPRGAAPIVQHLAPPGNFYPLPSSPPFALQAAPASAGWGKEAVGDDWLLRYPFKLSDTDINDLGSDSTHLDSILFNATGAPSLHRVIDTTNGSTWLPYVAVARYGAGAVVVTAGDVGYDIVHWWLCDHFSYPREDQAADCKLAWNVAALASSWRQQRGGPSQRSASIASLPPVLDLSWQYPGRFEPLTSNQLGEVVGSPVEGQGMVFALALGSVGGRPPTLMCLDADPAEDLDRDGRADDAADLNGDGIPDKAFIDYSLGKSYDMVWYQSLGTGVTTRYSSPTLATLSGVTGSGINLQVVLVSVVATNPTGHSIGQVRCYNGTIDPRVLAEVPSSLPAPYHTAGALIWTRDIDTYSSTGAVIDLSTPTVFKGYVYVLASEYDPNAGSGIEGAYGRAHCFLLNYRWDQDQNGPQWVYPQAAPNAELEKSLPPFQDPAWVAGTTDGVNNYNPRPELPPYPTQAPVVDEPTVPRANYTVDAYLRCSTPVSFQYTAATGQVQIDTNHGGSDYILLPTPTPPGSPYGDLTNYHHWLHVLPDAVSGTTTVTRIFRADQPANPNIWPATGGMATPSLITSGNYVYLWLQSEDVRKLLLPVAGSTYDPIGVPYAKIEVDYTVGGTAHTSSFYVYGNVTSRSMLALHDRHIAALAAENDRGFANDDVRLNDNGTIVGLANPEQGQIGASDLNNQSHIWTYLPDTETLPDPNGRQQLGASGMAVNRNVQTAYAAVTQALDPDKGNARAAVPEILGLNTRPDLTVQLLGNGPNSHLRSLSSTDFSVTTLNESGQIVALPSQQSSVAIYSVDLDTKTITFNPAMAGLTAAAGPLWGKPIWVSYLCTDPAAPGDPSKDVPITNELHVLPDPLRFQYSPEYVRLNHDLVKADSLSATLPNGGVLTGWASTETPVTTAPAGSLLAQWTSGFLLRGLLKVSEVQVNGAGQASVVPLLFMAGGEPLRPGSDFLVNYVYFDPATQTAVQVRGERHQIPVNFGTSVSSPALAGSTIEVGTEGFHPTRVRDPNDGSVVLDNNDLNSPTAGTGPILSPNGGRKSLLSLLWDPITRVVHGTMSETAYPDPSTYGLTGPGGDEGTPVVTSSPAVDGNSLFVGSRMMTQLNRVVSYQGQGLGFVSSLQPQHTLICDNSRLIEVTGQTPDWICLGSLAPSASEAFDPTTLGASELKPTPFSRPAKAIYLSNGDILVADSGNNRVVEINRQGRQVWPLDSNGYDYYTSPQNTNLTLSRPSDVFRYYVTTVGNTTYVSANGDILANTVTHTVIADSGNDRVVDVVTAMDPTTHLMTNYVYTLTPTSVRLPTQSGLTRITYTKARPIFDPASGAVIGYLCAAANLDQLVVVEAGTKMVDPPANRQPPNGTAGSNWAWLAWLYDSNLTDADYTPDNPLIFRNLRDVEYVREGALAYLTVTCGEYEGRLKMVEAGTPHNLSKLGAGVFEFVMNVGGAPGTWALQPAVDNTGQVLPDDPVWHFTRQDYIYANLQTHTRRPLTNILYTDADGTQHWLGMGFDPVAASRLPCDLRPTAAGDRIQEHLITNYAQMVQNLSRANVQDASAPASLYSSVFTVKTDDFDNNNPTDDINDIDRRQVIPNPNENDWPDPFNQPAFACRN